MALELASGRKIVGFKSINIFLTLQLDVLSDGSVSVPTITTFKTWEKPQEDKRKKIIEVRHEARMMDGEEI